jgi:hypothetical protein
MTPAPQSQPEYIITEEQLYKIYLHGYNHKAWETSKDVKDVFASHSASSDVLGEMTSHFKGFEDQKTFKYSAADIIQYIENFKKLEELRQQTKEHP